MVENNDAKATEVYDVTEKELKVNVKTAVYDEIHRYRSTGSKIIESTGGSTPAKWPTVVKQWRLNVILAAADIRSTSLTRKME